jgi:hypothetical protein
MNKHKIRFEKTIRGRLTAMAAFATFALLMAAGAPLGFAQALAPQTFSSPEEACRALFLAVKQNNDKAMMKVLGGGKALISLEDEVQNKAEREEFVNKYQEMHRLVREPDRTVVLYIGAENWPFPVPLVSRQGSWYFDSKTGMREVLYRRIGENETRAIETCHALAQGDRDNQSDLEGEPDDDSTTSTLRTKAKKAEAENESSAIQKDQPVESHGYYFRIVSGSNKNSADEDKAGVSVVAYPVEYRKTGVMTFIVSDDDVVYEKDLGPNTVKVAKSMTAYKPGTTWQEAK